MAKHEDREPQPLAFELLAFMTGVLHCDVPTCNRIATWRTPDGQPAIYRCAEHKTDSTTEELVTFGRTEPPRHADDHPTQD